MSKKSLIIILMALNSWLPWTTGAKELLADKKAVVVFTGQPGYARGMCCTTNPPSFSVNSNCARQDLPMVTLHETQHLLGHLYAETGQFPDWIGFDVLGISCALQSQPLRMRGVMKFAALGPWELHAQLPWLLRGKLCSELQPWYPWFDLEPGSLSRVAASQKDSPRPIRQ